MNKLLFETVHGSHLYGLAHAESDLDMYRVFEGEVRSTHKIRGKDDVTTVSLDKFLLQAAKGNPQALEAMFSQKATVDEISGLRANYQIDLGATTNTFSRTIRNFAHGGPKQRRHAMRLMCSLNDIWQTGKFNPTLDQDRIHHITVVQDALADADAEFYLKCLNTMSYVDLTKEEESDA